MVQVSIDPITNTDWLLSSRRPITRSQFRAFCHTNPDLRVELSAEGELIIMAPTNLRTGDQNAELTTQLRVCARQDGTGFSFDSSTGFDLPNGSNRSPDAAWVLKSRLAAIREKQQDEYIPLSPDFVVELRSPSDRLRVLHAKMHEYMECGVKLAWLIDPLERRVWVYRVGTAVEQFEEPATLVAGPLMPGFVLDLGRIWNSEV